MQIDFTGRTVLVAGAARGIGRGIVEAFAAGGARVFAADRLLDEMPSLPAAPSRVDVLDRAALHGWVTQTGGIADVLVYVAGDVLGQAAKPIAS